MVVDSSRHFLGRLRQLINSCRGSDLEDEQLLRRFWQNQDQTAFEALVHRHGTMVLGVCRRLLSDPQEIEDAFQATFLVLLRKAGHITRPERLGNWLYGVSLKVAARARRTYFRRQTQQQPLPEINARKGGVGADTQEVLQLLDEEVLRLPDKYRVPFVLCCLEGKTNDEAAHLLGCPRGTIATRLARARQRLRSRLEKRGAVLTSVALSSLLLSDKVMAVPAAFLVQKTIVTVRLFSHAKGSVTASVLALTEGVLQEMLIHKLKKVLSLALVFCLLCISAVVVMARQETGTPQQASPDSTPIPKPQADADKKKETLPTWNIYKSLQAGKGTVEALACSPDGRSIATLVSPNFPGGGISGVDGKSIDPTKVPMFDFNPNDFAIKLWNVQDNKPTLIPNNGFSSPFVLKFSPDGKYLAYGSTSVDLWNLHQKRVAHSLNQVISAWHVGFHPDSQKFLVVRADGWVRIYDLKGQKNLANLPAHKMITPTGAFVPESKKVLTLGNEGEMKVWDLGINKLVSTKKFPFKNLSTAALGPKGQVVACGSFGSTIQVWDIETQKLKVTLEGPGDQFASVKLAFSPDEKTLVAGYKDGTVIFWDVNEGRKVHTIKGHSQAVTAVSFANNGEYAATGDTGGTVLLWHRDQPAAGKKD